MEATENTPEFTDLAGHRWPLRLSVATVKAIRDATEIDFGVPEKFAQYWAELLSDDELAVRVLAAAIQPVAVARVLDVANFAEAVDGAVIEAALHALAEAVVLFTRPQKRGLVTDALAVINEHWQKAVGESRETIRSFTNEAAQQALARLGT